MLDVRDLECRPIAASPLLGTTIHVAAGELVAVVGPNGAGKTTLCRCIGLLALPSAGRIEVDGRRLSGEPHDAWRFGIMVTLKGKRVFPELTVMENLLAARGPWNRDGHSARLDQILGRFPILAQRRTQLAGTLSGGEQQIVAMARLALCSPRVLIVDEPSLGLSPRATAQVYETLREFARGGAAVLVTEENLKRLAPYANRAYVMVQGRVVAQGKASDVVGIAESHEVFNGTQQ